MEEQFDRVMMRGARDDAYLKILYYVVGRRQKNAADETIRDELNALIDKALKNTRKDGE